VRGEVKGGSAVGEVADRPAKFHRGVPTVLRNVAQGPSSVREEAVEVECGVDRSGVGGQVDAGDRQQWRPGGRHGPGADQHGDGAHLVRQQVQVAGGRWRGDPLLARPMGLRAVATMTASGMGPAPG